MSLDVNLCFFLSLVFRYSYRIAASNTCVLLCVCCYTSRTKRMHIGSGSGDVGSVDGGSKSGCAELVFSHTQRIKYDIVAYMYVLACVLQNSAPSHRSNIDN